MVLKKQLLYKIYNINFVLNNQTWFSKFEGNTIIVNIECQLNSNYIRRKNTYCKTAENSCY